MGKTIKYQKGQVVGECVFLYKTGRKRERDSYAMFQCKCGKEFETLISSVKRGTTKSCGCLQKEKSKEAQTKHGLRYHPLYQRWIDMKNRCYNVQCKDYKLYGGRGIVVYEEWRNDFKTYFDYIMALPNALKHRYSIDRINNNGNYEPGNIRWADDYMQVHNRRNTRF